MLGSWEPQGTTPPSRSSPHLGLKRVDLVHEANGAFEDTVKRSGTWPLATNANHIHFEKSSRGRLLPCRPPLSHGDLLLLGPSETQYLLPAKRPATLRWGPEGLLCMKWGRSQIVPGRKYQGHDLVIELESAYGRQVEPFALWLHELVYKSPRSVGPAVQRTRPNRPIGGRPTYDRMSCRQDVALILAHAPLPESGGDPI